MVKRSMVFLLGVLVVGGVASAQQTQPAEGAPASAAFDPSRSDAKAVKLADQMIEAMGGQIAWQRVRYLVFTFTVEKDGAVLASRKHFWDKGQGRHRIEGATKDGKKYVVLTDLRAHRGSAYLAGTRLEGDEAQKYLEQAYALFVNDTYWLAMPFKVKDPGVLLSDAGEEVQGGIKYQKMKLRFDGVGMTPRDVYWAYVNPETHRMDKWSFVLQGREEAPTLADWKGWRQHAGVWLSDEKDIPSSKQRILFPDLSAPPSLPDSFFTSAEAILPSEIPPEK